MVKVYITNVSNLPDPWCRPLIMQELPEERIEKAMRARRLEGRKQSLGAGLLLEYVQKKHYKSPESRQGAQHTREENTNYNLSHSGDYVICAVSNRPIGCDIEKIKEAPVKVAERYFAKSEAEYLKSLDAETQDEEFFRLWTIKESYTKMNGRGLSMGLKTFEVVFEEKNAETVETTEVFETSRTPSLSDKSHRKISIIQNGNKIDCHIKEYQLDGYKISICAEEEAFEDELEHIEFQ